MPELFIDKLEHLRASESRGVMRSCERKARVIFTQQELTAADLRNVDVLTAALDELDSRGLSYGSGFGLIGTQDSRYNNLVLIDREPSLAEGDSTVVDVILKYQHVLDGPNQTVRAPESGFIFGKGRCSIVEKPTNFFYPYGDRTKPKTQILVGHTYNENDTGIVGMAFEPGLPRTVIQGGEVNIPYPQENFQFQGIMETFDPLTTAQRLVGRVNSKDFLGRPKWTYICSEVGWEMHDASLSGPNGAPRYRMSFEFQYNNDGWFPTAVFVDPRTNAPPAKLYEALYEAEAGPLGADEGHKILRMSKHPQNDKEFPAGYWTVPALPEIDFEDFFGATFETSVFPPPLEP